MSKTPRRLALLGLLVMTQLLSACIVLPWHGGRHGGHGGHGRHGGDDWSARPDHGRR